MSFERTYTDPDGQAVDIRESRDHTPGAYVEHYGSGIAIPAHRLAEFVGDLYQAVGQPVPDLPVIHDPKLINSLAAELSKAFDRHGNDFRAVADTLLADGYRKRKPASPGQVEAAELMSAGGSA